MTRFIQQALRQQRMILLGAIVLTLIGAAMWRIMPRQEDPEITARFGMITATFPGAEPATVERLVVEPLEDALAEVEELDFMTAEASQGFAMLKLGLKGSVSENDLDRIWTKISDAVERATLQFPAGAKKPFVDRAITDLEGVVLCITGSNDLSELRRAARSLRDELLSTDGVVRIALVGDPGDEIVVGYDPATLESLGLSPSSLVSQLADRNQVLPGGSVESGERQVIISPSEELADTNDLAKVQIRLQNGEVAPLDAVASVRRGPFDPPLEAMRLNGRPSVGLALVLRSGGNVVTVGERLRARVEELRQKYAPLRVSELLFQPDRVKERVSQMGGVLLSSALIVGALASLIMGWRMGLLVVLALPMVALSSVGIYAVTGGAIHQISTAALVISLGMLVDNVIVVSEAMVRRLDHGLSGAEAAIQTVSELAGPLFCATGTTVAAFVPMMLSQGNVGDFTRAIPIVVTIALVVSYVFAVLVTPVLGRYILRPTPQRNSTRLRRWDGVASRLGHFAAKHASVIIVATVAAIFLVAVVGQRVKRSFFPAADRNQLVVEISLADGTRIAAVDEAAATLEDALAGHRNVANVASFIGRSVPHFYYNIRHLPRSPQIAQLLVTTTGTDDNHEVEELIDQVAKEHLQGVQVVTKELQQGPASAAPIEVRVAGQNLKGLDKTTRELSNILRQIPGTRSVRDTLSLGGPAMRFDLLDVATKDRNISRADLAAALAGHTRGTLASYLRTEDEPIPIVVRANSGVHTSIVALEGVQVTSPAGEAALVGEVSTSAVVWKPTHFVRRDRKRISYILANLQAGYALSDVMDVLESKLGGVKLPPGVSIELGGDAEGSTEANAALVGALPLGLLLLVGFLLVQFNSFRRVLVILTTVPLAAIGVVPGLLISHEAFGFMAILGTLSLAGLVVNNAIVLLEVVVRCVRAGTALPDALAEAVRLRTRPIMLTSATTIVGLLPLAFSSASLWPPMAWAMIGGLTSSTVLALLFVPALYRVLFAKQSTRPPAAHVPA